ncbi:hypothetical protein HPP92_027723 [Vanilla planifolia]|uniref:Uncharacterized protein n=1 Tax=Vanilla planifolia TaxID=51239 RepID=A0A835PAP8_VANPL|nr:hypothetical protein HPP92_027723 [Vanilla planifolia]
MASKLVFRDIFTYSVMDSRVKTQSLSTRRYLTPKGAFRITQFRVEPITNKNDSSASVNKKGSDDVDHICRIVSKQSISTVTTSLDTAGISVSPVLTTEVLKKLSNAGMLALLFPLGREARRV